VLACRIDIGVSYINVTFTLSYQDETIEPERLSLIHTMKAWLQERWEGAIRWISPIACAGVLVVIIILATTHCHAP
jgi:hypothetical protein